MDFKDIIQLQKEKKSKLEFQKGLFKSLLKEREKSPSSSISIHGVVGAGTVATLGVDAS